MQLLRITSTPMKYQFVTEAPRLEYTNDLGGYTMTKTGGNFDIRSQNTRLQLDSANFRNDMGYKNHEATMQDFAQRSRRSAQESVANRVDFGNDVIHIEKGASIPDILYSRLMQDKSSPSLQMVPLSPIQMNWSPPQLDVSYEPVRQSFDWRTAKSSMEFIPGKFSMNITQYPEIHIEYLGKPIYVPASAAPDY